MQYILKIINFQKNAGQTDKLKETAEKRFQKCLKLRQITKLFLLLKNDVISKNNSQSTFIHSKYATFAGCLR